MEIKHENITIREISAGYQDNNEEGVVAHDGELDVRPPYQREFVYKEKQRDAVIKTLKEEFPLNVMYWAVKDDGNYEIIDGQQRTISICQYINSDFSYEEIYFHNLKNDEREKIYNYKLDIYKCSGSDSEKLNWFRTINIAGEKLTDQELKNAVYAGTWTADAKRYFSKKGCAAYRIGSDYMNGSAIRQDYLETAIKWISDDNIEDYMGIHQHDKDASDLWDYFQAVIDWIEVTFKTRLKNLTKNVNWGKLYNEYKDAKLDADELDKEFKKLIDDEEVTKQAGIYAYLLTHNKKYLSLRTFEDQIKNRVYQKQEGKCNICKDEFEMSSMEGDHKDPWSKGGKTVESNCQMICKTCNLAKSDK